MSSRSRGRRISVEESEENAALLIQKTFRGLLGRKTFAKELLQKERGKRRSDRRSANKKLEAIKSIATREDIVIVQAVKKQPVKIATSSQSSTPLIKSNAAVTMNRIERDNNHLLNYTEQYDNQFDGYDDTRASMDSLQQDDYDDHNESQGYSKEKQSISRKMQLSGIQEVDEDIIRDSLNSTLRHHSQHQLPSKHQGHRNNDLLAGYEDLEDSAVSDSLDLGRQTDRLSAAGTVPWPKHHGRSKTVMPDSSAGSSGIKYLSYDIIEEDQDIPEKELLEDSLEYQLMMKDLLSSPLKFSSRADSIEDKLAQSPMKKFAAPPLSQPPALCANNHQEIFSPVTKTTMIQTSPKRKSTTSAKPMAKESDEKKHWDSDSTVDAVISAPVAAAAAGSKIPLRQAPPKKQPAISQPVNPLKAQVISAGIPDPLETNSNSAPFRLVDQEDAKAVPNRAVRNNNQESHNTSSNSSQAQHNAPTIVRKGPPTIKDLLEAMPPEEVTPSSHSPMKINSTEHKEDKLTRLQRMYAADVASNFTNKQPHATDHQQPKLMGNYDEVNMVMLSQQQCPVRADQLRALPSRKKSSETSTYDNNAREDDVIHEVSTKDSDGEDLVNLRVHYQHKQQQYHQSVPQQQHHHHHHQQQQLQQLQQPAAGNKSALRKPVDMVPDDNVSVLTDASPYPVHGRATSGSRPAKQSNHQPYQQQSTAYSKNHAAGARRISFSDDVLQPTPRERAVNDNASVGSMNGYADGYSQQYAQVKPKQQAPERPPQQEQEYQSKVTNSSAIRRPPKPTKNAAESVYHHPTSQSSSNNNNYNSNNPSTKNRQQQEPAILKSQELERKLLEEIAALNRKQQQLHDVHQQQQHPSPPHAVVPIKSEAVANADAAANARKSASASKTRPSVPIKEKVTVDPTKDKEKKAFGWGARDFRPHQQQQQQQHPVGNSAGAASNVSRKEKLSVLACAGAAAVHQFSAISPREIVQEWRAASLHDSGQKRAPAGGSSHHPTTEQSANGYEQKYSLKQDHLALAHVHLDVGPGYLQDFHKRREQQQQHHHHQQQRSLSAQRHGRRVVVDNNGDEHSYYSAQSAASSSKAIQQQRQQQQHRSESVSLPPLLPYQQHLNLAVAGDKNTRDNHPFDPPNRRVAPSSRHSTRSAPS